MAMIEHLEVGNNLAATLVDGVEDTPHVICTVSLDGERGLRVIVPYVQNADEFKSVREWFEEDGVPAHLSVIGNDIRFDLFGCRNSGLTTNSRGTAEGYIDVEEAVLKERDGDFSDPLTIKEVSSEMDGLYEWARLQSVTSDFESEGDGWTRSNTLKYTVKTAHGLVWKQGAATLSISTRFRGTSGRGISLDEEATLTSSFEEPRPFRDHLVEQRKFVAFLSLMFGTTISFRIHRIRDERYTTKSMGGTVHGYPNVELISRQTIGEHSKPHPAKKELDHPIVRMANMTAESLRKWADHYDDWDRFILPISGVYRIPQSMSFVENTAINSAMSLEALGSALVGYVDGEEATYQYGKRTKEFADRMQDPATSKKVSSKWKTVATDIYRGIKPLGLSWKSIAADEIGLARAIANNYNTLKHPSKGAFPDTLQTRLLSDISSSVVRLNALKLVTDDEVLITGRDATQQFRRPMEIFRSEQLFIDSEGRFTSPLRAEVEG